MNIEIIMVMSIPLTILTVLFVFVTGGFDETTHLDVATAQTATADVELDVFEKMEKDVVDYKSDASFMTTEEKKTEGEALLERIEILLTEAGTAKNQDVVDRLLSQEQKVEEEMAYGL
jgi:hypothetical protein